METRKVQLTGSSTYTISLPKEWAAEQGIEPGQRLNLCPQEGGTLVVAAGRDDEPAPVADVSEESPEEVRRTVRALYTLGYDEFGLRASGGLSAEIRRAITDATADLMGLEVVAEDDDEVRCRDLLDTDEISLERVVSRLQFVVLSAHREATSAFLGADEERAAEVERHRRDATAEVAVVERYFQRTLTDAGELDRLGVSRQVVLDYLRVAEQLDRVGELATDLADLVGSGPESPPDEWGGEFTERAQDVRLLIESATSAALSEIDPADTREIRREYRSCLEEIDALLAGDADSRTRLRAVDTLERAADCGWEIGQRAHQAALRREGTGQ